MCLYVPCTTPRLLLPTLISCFLLHLETGNESMGLFVRSWLSGKNKILTRNLRGFFHNSISNSLGTSALSMTFLPFTVSHCIPFLTKYRLSPSTVSHHVPSLTKYLHYADSGLPTLTVQTLAEDVLPPDHHVHRRAKTLPPVRTHAR